jgi:acetyltransferase-like isoleucine patch superfamily enzyme
MCGVNIGSVSFMGTNVNIDSEHAHMVTIKDHVCIAPNVSIIAHGSGSPYHRHMHMVKETIIEEGAWIAIGAIILPGVCVGRGAIVAAGAVVSKDVPEFTIVAGNPARVAGKVT